MAEPPWVLRGAGLLAWVRPGAVTIRLPPGIRPLPGPAAVVAMSYDDTPVGPYRELSIAVPARLNLRPALCTIAIVVTSPEARLVCRQDWGLPADLGDLRWSVDDEDRQMVWQDGGLVLQGRAWGPEIVAVAPLRWAQWRSSGPVVLPRRLWTRMRPARCQVDADPDGQLAWLGGRHPGLALQGARVVAHAARRPAGLLSSVPWRERPLGRSPEPAGGAAATMTSPGAYDSVG